MNTNVFNIYFILFVVSLLFIKMCLDRYNKQQGIHYIIFCILGALTNLSYWQLSTADNSRTYLIAQAAIYTTMLFIPVIIFNMIDDIVENNHRILQNIGTIIASVFVISVQTTDHTDLFYKSVEMSVVDGVNVFIKEYGILHDLCVGYIVGVFLLLILRIAMTFKKNYVSKNCLGYIFGVASLIIFGYLLDKLNLSNNEVLPVFITIAEYIFIKLAYIIPLYDTSEAIVEANEEAKETGIILFDKKRRLLAYNNVISDITPSIKNQKIDHRISKEYPLYEELNQLIDDVDNNDSISVEIVEYNDSFYMINTKYLLMSKRIQGYQMLISDVSKQQNRLYSLEKELTNKSAESIKYLDLLKKQIDPYAIDKIINNEEISEEKEVVVLFADINNFTTLSEKMSAKDVVDLLNNALSICKECITNNNGVIDKYIGDCVMAYWCDNNTKDNVDMALRAALDIKKRCKEITSKNNEISFSIGINVGNCVVGFVGDKTHKEFTVIGDVVNTASRIQSIAPENKIYISEEVSNYLEDKYLLLEVGEKELKGKSQKIQVIEVIGRNVKE